MIATTGPSTSGANSPAPVPGPYLSPPGHDRRRRRTLIGGLALAAALGAIVALLLWPASGTSGPSVRSALPFSLPDVRDGASRVVLDARPGRPVVLNFFAAWCDPCHEELPLLAALQRREGARLAVLGVDVQDNRTLATQLLADARVGFPAGYDPGRAVGDPWGVNGLPVTAFIAPDGTVVDLHRGQLRQRDLDRLVGRLLATGASQQHRQS